MHPVAQRSRRCTGRTHARHRSPQPSFRRTGSASGAPLLRYEPVIVRFMILFRKRPFCRRVRNPTNPMALTVGAIGVSDARKARLWDGSGVLFLVADRYAPNSQK